MTNAAIVAQLLKSAAEIQQLRADLETVQRAMNRLRQALPPVRAIGHDVKKDKP